MRRSIETGSVYPRWRIWWIKFYYRNRPIRESSCSTDRQDAERLLKRRMGEVVTGQFRGLTPERVRLNELFRELQQDYVFHERHSLPHLRSRLKRLEALAPVRAADLTSRHIEKYILRRQREGAEAFGRRMYAEAGQRGWNGAKKKVVMGDGAVWIWNRAEEHFPGALQIVDLYHARQHLWELAGKLWPADKRHGQRWAKKLQKKLDQGRIEALAQRLRDLPPPHREATELLRVEADYFARHAERMRYPQFRRQNLFVGSGVIEAGCKTIVGSRLKRSGMFWTVRGANAIIALRCNRLSGEFETYGENRRARAA